MTFPEQLKTHRQQLGLTQAGLASLLSVSPRAIWQWEKGVLPHVLTQEGALLRLSKLNNKEIAERSGRAAAAVTC